MYHQAIHINFWQRAKKSDPTKIDFNYSFLIAKIDSSIFDNIRTDQQVIQNLMSYQELLFKFESLGFNTSFLIFPDIKDKNQLLWCNYNGNDYQVFFRAYDRILKNQHFNINFEYGNVVENKNDALVFLENNMNGPAVIELHDFLGGEGWGQFHEEVIQGKTFYKFSEVYKIVDKNGEVIAREDTNWQTDFESHFFENKDVQLYLRKYKLQELKQSLFS